MKKENKSSFGVFFFRVLGPKEFLADFPPEIACEPFSSTGIPLLHQFQWESTIPNITMVKNMTLLKCQNRNGNGIICAWFTLPPPITSAPPPQDSDEEEVQSGLHVGFFAKGRHPDASAVLSVWQVWASGEWSPALGSSWFHWQPLPCNGLVASKS